MQGICTSKNTWNSHVIFLQAVATEYYNYTGRVTDKIDNLSMLDLKSSM